MDAMPEMLMGPIGYMDDVIIAAMAFNTILNNTDREVIDEY
jgi:uncharacterized membrane protein YkvA (DUF1232 family)